MRFTGTTTIVGRARLSELKKAKQGLPYRFLDVQFDEETFSEKPRWIGFVLFGEHATKAEEFYGRECMANLVGHICTKSYKTEKERISTGIELAAGALLNPIGDDVVMLESGRFIAFR